MSVDLPDDIIGFEDYTESINMMIYADSGMGKTIVAGSDKTLVLATEDGTIAAARQGAKRHGGAVWPTKTVESFTKAVDWLEENVEDPKFPYRWVSVDTATELQSIMLRHLVDRRVEEGIAKSLNPFKVELQEYGEMHEMFRTYVRKLNDLPVNVLWTAQAMMTEDEEGNEFRMPMFQGKGNQMAMWMASKMHCYGYLHLANVAVKTDSGTKTVQRRRIQWQASEHVRAKDRFDALGKFTTVGDASKTAPLKDLTKMILDSATIEEPTPAPKKAPAKKVAPAKAAATA